MNTKVKEPLAASQMTHVSDMPPLEVVTEGIPPKEQIEFAPATQGAPHPVVREGWGRKWAWALAGVTGLLLVVAGAVALTQTPVTPDVTAVPAVGFDVPTMLPYAMPVPPVPPVAAIPSMADISIAPIAAISPMTPLSSMDIPTMPTLDIPTMSTIDIPAIPDITIAPIALPAAPVAPETPAVQILDMTIAPIDFPSFPAIPSISIPSIRPFPSISIPPFPAISITPYSDR